MQNSVMMALPGYGNVQVSEVEYTSTQLIQSYVPLMASIKSVLDHPTDDATDYASLVADANSLGLLAKSGVTISLGSFSYQDYFTSQMVQDFNKVLKYMLAAGIDPSVNPNSISPSQKTKALETWRNMGGFGLQAALIDGSLLVGQIPVQETYIDANGEVQTKTVFFSTSPTRTFQSMVETEYVQTANNIIQKQLTTMQNALNVSTSILSTLTDLQNIQNNLQVNPVSPPFIPPSQNTPTVVLTTTDVVEPPPPPPFPGNDQPLAPGLQVIVFRDQGQNYLQWPLGGGHGSGQIIFTSDIEPPGINTPAHTHVISIDPPHQIVVANWSGQFDPNSYIPVYEAAVNAYFFPNPIPLGGPPIQFSNPVALANLVTRWQTDYNDLQDYLDQLDPTGTQRTTLNTLANNIASVLNDISNSITNGGGAAGGLSHWVLDNNNTTIGTGGPTGIGAIQNNMSSAVLNAQNLNQTNKQQVQANLQVFQQFYQSTAAIMTLLSKLIVDFGTGTDEI